MKLSIITINRNNAAGLEKTLKSVAEQTFTDFEYIVIDGASTDNSVAIIKKYADKITFWISEPDGGIYNAMNKGIRRAKGDYCLFLNSGDWLIEQETLKILFNEIAISNTSNDTGVYYSDCMNSKHQLYKPPKIIDINFFLGHGLNHQNTIIKRSLFIEHGFYNEEFRISSDYEFWIKECWIYKTRFTYLNTRIAIYDTSGISSNSKFESEIEDSYRSIFGEFSEIVTQLHRYQAGTYGSIIETFGNSKLLEFFLKTYRYLIKRLWYLKGKR